MTEVGESGWDRRRNLLLGEYERVALELFAERGFRDVTVDDIADAAGVSARTLFRYFPTKDDFLLAFARRNVATMIRLVEAAAGEDPIASAWSAIRSYFMEVPVDVELALLWRRAASDAPDVVARVRGERVRTLMDALARHCARARGAEEPDVRDRFLGSVVAGLEMALVETWGRSDLSLPELIAVAEDTLALLRVGADAGPGAGPGLAPPGGPLYQGA